MKPVLKITIDENHLRELPQLIRQKMGVLVRHTGMQVVGQARTTAPRDTGALANSIVYERIAPLVGEVQVGVNYGHFVEYGTSNQSAQPYMTPAVDANRQPFVEAAGRLIDQAAKEKEVSGR